MDGFVVRKVLRIVCGDVVIYTDLACLNMRLVNDTAKMLPICTATYPAQIISGNTSSATFTAALTLLSSIAIP